jgi:hypothetical protein
VSEQEVILGGEYQQKQENPKKLWQLLKEVSTGSNEISKIEKIKIDGKLITGPHEIANKFKGTVARDFRSSVFFFINQPHICP